MDANFLRDSRSTSLYDSSSSAPSLTSSNPSCVSDVDSTTFAKNIDRITSLERAFCSSFMCCNTCLYSLHELLEHFEEKHVTVVDASGRTVYPTRHLATPRVTGPSQKVSTSIRPFSHHSMTQATDAKVQRPWFGYAMNYPQQPTSLLHSSHPFGVPIWDGSAYGLCCGIDTEVDTGLGLGLDSLGCVEEGIKPDHKPFEFEDTPPPSPSPSSRTSYSSPSSPITSSQSAFWTPPSSTASSPLRTANRILPDVEVRASDDGLVCGVSREATPHMQRRDRVIRKHAGDCQGYEERGNKNAKSSKSKSPGKEPSGGKGKSNNNSNVVIKGGRRREKNYKCPVKGCVKSYLNPNGLKYHIEKGTCKMATDPYPSPSPTLPNSPAPARFPSLPPSQQGYLYPSQSHPPVASPGLPYTTNNSE